MREFGTLPNLIVNEAEVAPAATLTVAGTASRLLPEDKTIVLPLAGAALFSVMMQVLVP